MDPVPTFVQNVVLVAGAQSSQDYRACANFIQCNSRVEEPAHPMHDCQEILDELGHCRVYSAMDLKAGFLNVPIHPDW